MPLKSLIHSDDDDEQQNQQSGHITVYVRTWIITSWRSSKSVLLE
jgi:hypothetical protein